ncbi:MAG: hypothetical protein KTR31_33920 [Myxococcales bacterium]|nr:hypothetical protein [Myxococcales bacterium]
MHDDVPDNLKKAAMFQIVSGLVNLVVLPALIWAGAGLCGAVTFGLGGLCGLASCALWPIGIFEIVAGAIGLSDPRRGAALMRYATFAEYASLLAGGVHSAVVGYVVSSMLDDAEIQAFLEDHQAMG